MLGCQVTVANAGDSRAVLCRDGVALPMSVDHTVDDPAEHERVRAAGGEVEYGRVVVPSASGEDFRLTRLIGNRRLRPDAAAQRIVTCLPDLREAALGAADSFLLLATDGVWDCLSSQAAVDYVLSRRVSSPLPPLTMMGPAASPGPPRTTRSWRRTPSAGTVFTTSGDPTMWASCWC